MASPCSVFLVLDQVPAWRPRRSRLAPRFQTGLLAAVLIARASIVFSAYRFQPSDPNVFAPDWHFPVLTVAAVPRMLTRIVAGFLPLRHFAHRLLESIRLRLWNRNDATARLLWGAACWYLRSLSLLPSWRLMLTYLAGVLTMELLPAGPVRGSSPRHWGQYFMFFVGACWLLQQRRRAAPSAVVVGARRRPRRPVAGLRCRDGVGHARGLLGRPRDGGLHPRSAAAGPSARRGAELAMTVDRISPPAVHQRGDRGGTRDRGLPRTPSVVLDARARQPGRERSARAEWARAGGHDRAATTNAAIGRRGVAAFHEPPWNHRRRSLPGLPPIRAALTSTRSLAVDRDALEVEHPRAGKPQPHPSCVHRFDIGFPDREGGTPLSQ